MKQKFPEYYSLSKPQFRALVSRALIVVDTNVLLGLYRSSERTGDEMLRVFDAARDRLWIPYQIGFEYHERLEETLADLRGQHSAFLDVLKRGLDQLRGSFGQYRHPFIREHVLASIDDLEKRLQVELEKPAWRIAKLEERIDLIQKKIERAFRGDSVGMASTKHELAEIIKDGQQRYEKRIPPGFADKKKEIERHQFGDLILWKQIIAKAKASKLPVIFVTDDQKEDWYWRISGKTRGPLPALRREMFEESGQSFYAYTSEQFLREVAPVLLKRAVSSEAVADAERASRADQLSLSELQRLLGAQAIVNNQSYLEQLKLPDLTKPSDFGIKPLDFGVNPPDFGIKPLDFGVESPDFSIKPAHFGIQPLDLTIPDFTKLPGFDTLPDFTKNLVLSMLFPDAANSQSSGGESDEPVRDRKEAVLPTRRRPQPRRNAQKMVRRRQRKR